MILLLVYGLFSILDYNSYSENNLRAIESPYSSDLESWLYERQITISPATPENDFQIKIQLSPSNFNYSRANTDGSDLRFFDLSNNPLSYWIENWNVTGISNIYVRISGFGISSILMRYGNPLAISASDGDSTFVFFDDFEQDNIDENKWYTTGVTGYNIVEGKLIITTDDDTGNNLLTTKNPINLNSFIIEYKVNCYNDFRINLFCSQSPIRRITGGGNWYMMLVPWSNDDSRIDWFINGYWQSPKVFTGGPHYSNYVGTLKMKYNSVNNQQVWLNTSSGVMFNNITLDKFSITDTFLSVSKDGGYIANLSHIAVRKYSEIEPIIIIGDERGESIAPIIMINHPQNADQLSYTPVYDISIEETNLDEVWYTIDEGMHNYTINELIGTINSAAWNAAPLGPVTIRFYARDLAGNVGTAFVIVIKTSAQKKSSSNIPGYNIYILLGIVGIISTIFIKRNLKS